MRRRAKIVALTIDANIQKPLEDLARERARALGPDISVAIVAIDHGTGEVLARVAGADYFDERRAGQVDMTQAVRSPGSTLKPFIYGLGFEDGLIHPETLIEDRPVRYGTYAPENFDLTFQGTVAVRKALQMSLNVPAVAVLNAIHASRLTARLTDAGGRFVWPKGEIPGLAMGLGGVGVTLADLTMLYGGIARGGNTVALVERRDVLEARRAAPAARSGRRLVSRQCADRHAAAGKRRGRAHRVQDRHELRLSRCVVGRLRRQAHRRRVGRPPGWRAGAGPRRAQRRGADPVRCLRADARPAGRSAQGAERRGVRDQQPVAAAVAALPPRRAARRHRRGRAAHHVPAERRAARAARPRAAKWR